MITVKFTVWAWKWHTHLLQSLYQFISLKKIYLHIFKIHHQSPPIGRLRQARPSTTNNNNIAAVLNHEHFYVAERHFSNLLHADQKLT